ncbi:MAG: hypothetical protein JJE50_07205 [Actinomycetales bacterium]|nr:hypothetical protein [Actinomycetales bacterium]
MPRSITIRNLPDETVDELAARAAASGRSLQEYLSKRLIDVSREPDVEVWLARVDARKAANPQVIGAQRILELRDLDRE